MARPREFDIDEALDHAMGVFWAKGYEAASLQDLLGAMKIARGSLYKAFKDKRSIYLAALDLYDKTTVETGVSLLSDPEAGDGLSRIRTLLEGVRDDEDRRGCFLCNAAIDQARVDPEVEARVAAMMRRLEAAFSTALKQSKRAGRWSAKRRTETARFIFNTYMGLRVLARSGYPTRELQAIIDAALRDL
jgi:TetR/AcrR family transcriptional regulator, transcriptional repressor for nem operon